MMMKYRVCSSNILNDQLADKELISYQKDRLPELIDDIKSLCSGTPDVLFLCELSSPKHAEKIAKALKMSVVDTAKKYSNRDYMAFLVKPALKKDAKSKFIKFDKELSSKTGFLRMDLGGIQYYGVHYPYRPLEDLVYRYQFSSMLSKNRDNAATVVMGDFNSLTLMPEQLRLYAAGLRKTRWKTPARTPNDPFYNNEMTVPRYLPKATIDAIFYSKELMSKNSDWLYSDTTDHPIIYTEIENS